MTRLDEWNSTRLLDHVRGWWILMAAGRQPEAMDRARASDAAPVTAQLSDRNVARHFVRAVFK